MSSQINTTYWLVINVEKKNWFLKLRNIWQNIEEKIMHNSLKSGGLAL